MKRDNITVGLLRPKGVFFYEIDCKKGEFRKRKERLIFWSKVFFENDFAIYRTKHGYHLIARPFMKSTWECFANWFPSDYMIKLRPRWNNRNPQVLRISPKWNFETGKQTSPSPRLIYGKIDLGNVDKLKVIYRCK